MEKPENKHQDCNYYGTLCVCYNCQNGNCKYEHDCRECWNAENCSDNAVEMWKGQCEDFKDYE